MTWFDPFVRAGRALMSSLGGPRAITVRAPDMPALPAAVLRELPPGPFEAPLAPAPLVDRTPAILGSGVTVSYIAAVMRLCIAGDRRPFVDLVRELFERDGSTKQLVSQRVLTVAGGRVEISPPEIPADHPDHDLAAHIADVCRTAFFRIPDLRQAMATLAWGGCYGVACCETGWHQGTGLLHPGDVRESPMVLPERLYTIAQRRLNYPNAQTLDLHVWDQGQVRADDHGSSPTNAHLFGLNVARYPGKFLVHTPAYAADYPWREGWARELVWLMAFKNLGLRMGVQFVERFSKVLIWASYTTSPDGKPRAANEDDITKADIVARSLGIGSLAAAVIPDSITLHMETAAKGSSTKSVIEQWVDLIDKQASIVVRGNAFTTAPGANGSRGASETAGGSEAENERYDAGCLADTIRRDLIAWIVRLNWPGREHLIPDVKIHLAEPGPAAILDLATKASAAGVPVDADWCAAQCGLRTVPNESGKPRRMIPLKPVEISAEALGGDDAARAEAQAQAAALQAKQAADAAAKARAAALPARADNDNAPEDGADELPQAAE